MNLSTYSSCTLCICSSLCFCKCYCVIVFVVLACCVVQRACNEFPNFSVAQASPGHLLHHLDFFCHKDHCYNQHHLNLTSTFTLAQNLHCLVITITISLCLFRLPALPPRCVCAFLLEWPCLCTSPPNLHPSVLMLSFLSLSNTSLHPKCVDAYCFCCQCLCLCLTAVFVFAFVFVFVYLHV